VAYEGISKGVSSYQRDAKCPTCLQTKVLKEIDLSSKRLMSEVLLNCRKCGEKISK
jgi:uncharacterized Zn finger protein